MHTITKEPKNLGASKTATNKETLDNPSMASNEFYKFLDDIEDLVKASTSLTGDDLAKAKAELNERIAVAKSSLTAVGSSIALRAKKAASVSNNYVHDQPWLAIGAGSAIGFLLGFMIARRS